MMNQEVIIQVMHIRRRGQVFYFQVNLPPHVTRVKAIQTGLRISGPHAPTGRSWQTGQLTLQAEGNMNHCYNHVVMAEPVQAMRYDLGLTSLQAGFIQPTALHKDGVASKTRHDPDPVDFPKCRTIYGVYKDMLADNWQGAAGYDLTLTLWAQIIKMGSA